MKDKKLPRKQRTLGFLVESMRGNVIVVEMKNDVEVTGMLEEASPDMNLVLTNARQVTSKGVATSLDVAFLQGHMVRYVHIPDQINIRKNLMTHVNSLQRAMDSGKRAVRKTR